MSGGPGDDAAPKGAVLDILDKKGKVTKTIPVQFNPSSLRLTLSNSVDGGTSRGRQVQQYNGSSSTQLHVELEFDTADEGTRWPSSCCPRSQGRSRRRRACSSGGDPSRSPA
jgi:hypothetical protein